MYNAPYTDEQKEFIRQHCSEMTAAELMILFNETFHENRTKKGLQYFIRSNGLKCVCPKNTWADGFTEEQKDFMRKYGGTISRPALTKKFNQHFGTSFSYGTIRNWCYRNKVPCINKNFRFTSETSPRWQKGMPADEFKSHYTDESFRKMTESMRKSNIQYHIGDEILRHGLPCIIINENFGHATVFSCYDSVQDCAVISDLCASTLGEEKHRNAIELLKDNITAERVVESCNIP